MKAIQWMVVSAAVATGMSAPASAGINDPEVIIYRFPGVRDFGTTNSGVATVFHCTNFSGVDETIRFVTRFSTNAIASNVTVTIPHLATRTAATHLTAAYFNQTDLTTTAVSQGTTAIAATSINIICTAETIDAGTLAPIGVARRGIRFSPVQGSQE